MANIFKMHWCLLMLIRVMKTKTEHDPYQKTIINFHLFFWALKLYVKWYEAGSLLYFRVFERCVDSWVRNEKKKKINNIIKKQDECDNVSLKFNRHKERRKKRENKEFWKEFFFFFSSFIFYLSSSNVYSASCPQSFMSAVDGLSRIYPSTQFPILSFHLYFDFSLTKSKHVFGFKKKKKNYKNPVNIHNE